MPFSDNCGYSLKLYQNSTSRYFLKVTCKYCYIKVYTLKFIGSYFVLEWNFYPHMIWNHYILDIWKTFVLLRYATLLDVDIVHYTVSKNHIH